jgi:SAM-dependent methyltransferase
MDQNRLSFLAHATHRFLSPVSEAMLERALAAARPAPGALAYDLGCGTAAVTLYLAERWGLWVTAVDRSPLMIEEARRRIGSRAAPGTIDLLCDSSVDFLARVGPADLVLAIGAVALTAGAQDAASVLGALALSVKPGGVLIWGESLWKREPSEAMRAILGPTAAVYGSHADYIRAGETAGLLPIYATTSSDQDWDEYSWRYTNALEDHLRAHPDEPDAAAIRMRAYGWRALYIAEGRDTMGFGLYAFRKPG